MSCKGIGHNKTPYNVFTGNCVGSIYCYISDFKIVPNT